MIDVALAILCIIISLSSIGIIVSAILNRIDKNK